MSTSTLSTPSSKHCRPCGRLRPIDEFRRVDSTKDWPRHSECRECRNRRERSERSRRRLPRLRDRLRQVKAARTLERIDSVLQAMLTEFGGINGFAAAVNELLRTGRPEDRWRVANCILALSRADQEAAEKERQAQHQAELDLEDPAVQRQLAKTGLQWLLKHPEQLEPHVTGIIARKPSILRDVLEHRTVKALLTQWGYRRED
jgi:hypothetical protein